ncbi:MAG: hypothetical protein R3E18_02070 [Sphingomonadaceae bacterium]|nr:hypothetical protein [Sphingomonadaceae bacterium]
MGSHASTKSALKDGASAKPASGTTRPAIEKDPATKEPGKDGKSQPATNGAAAPQAGKAASQEKPPLSSAGQESIALIKPEIDHIVADEGPADVTASGN